MKINKNIRGKKKKKKNSVKGGPRKTKRTLSKSFYNPSNRIKYFNLTFHCATISHTQLHGYSIYSRKVEQLNHMFDIRRNTNAKSRTC